MTRASSAGVGLRLSSGLAAIFATGCLLTTSLDGLEGPPPFPDASAGGSAGASGTEGGAADGGSGAAAGGSSDAGPADDGRVLDAAGDGSSRGPFTVADAGGALRGIAEHGTEVFWIQSDTSAGVVRAPKQGGQSAYFHVTADAFDVAVDDDYVYWSTGKGNEVHRKALTSSAPASELLFSGAGETLYLAVSSDGRLYVTGSDVIAAGPHADAGTSDVLYSLQAGAAGVALNGADLFWSLGASIVRGNDTGQAAPQPIYRGAAGEMAGIATDADDVYWIGADGGVRALSLTNPGVTVPREVCRADIGTDDAGSDGGALAAPDIAVDEQWVYFTEPARRRISKCRKR